MGIQKVFPKNSTKPILGEPRRETTDPVKRLSPKPKDDAETRAFVALFYHDVDILCPQNWRGA